MGEGVCQSKTLPPRVTMDHVQEKIFRISNDLFWPLSHWYWTWKTRNHWWSYMGYVRDGELKPLLDSTKPSLHRILFSPRISRLSRNTDHKIKISNSARILKLKLSFPLPEILLLSPLLGTYLTICKIKSFQLTGFFTWAIILKNFYK